MKLKDLLNEQPTTYASIKDREDAILKKPGVKKLLNDFSKLMFDIEKKWGVEANKLGENKEDAKFIKQKMGSMMENVGGIRFGDRLTKGLKR